MVKLGVREIDRLASSARSVELESNWNNHVEELGMIIRNASYNGYVHMVIYNSSKYCDVHRLYHELEPYIEALDNVSVFWENSVEAIAYHALILGEMKNSYLFVILPYNRKHVSQIENTYLYKFKKLLERVYSNGWQVVIVNPVINHVHRHGLYIADLTLRIMFHNGEAHVRVLNRQYVEKHALLKIFKHVM